LLSDEYNCKRHEKINAKINVSNSVKEEAILHDKKRAELEEDEVNHKSSCSCTAAECGTACSPKRDEELRDAETCIMKTFTICAPYQTLLGPVVAQSV
jgi:hypothetical protein